MKKLYILLTLIIPSFLFSQTNKDRHNTSWTDAWVSCDISPNPNNLRPSSHWFMMDLGHTYALGTSTIWNYNDPDNLDYGVRRIAIDLSEDGITWEELGEYELSQAQSSSFYYGDVGPDFLNAQGKYVLFTVLETYGGECAALSEIKINVGEIVSSNKELVLVDKCLVSPNPFNDYLLLETEKVENGASDIRIFDVQGKSVFNQKVSLLNKSIERIDLPKLPSGVYTIEIRGNQLSCSSKIIKP